MFDFNKWRGGYSVCMQVEENPHRPGNDYHGLFDAHGKQRYGDNSIPHWMGLVLKQPNELTPNYNDLQALFHYNKADC